MEIWAEIKFPPEELMAESEDFAALSDDDQQTAFADSLVEQVGLDYQRAAFVESLVRDIGMVTGAELISHGQKMKSANEASAHLKFDGSGGYWLDVNVAFKGDREGAVRAAEKCAERVEALDGIAEINYVRLRGTDGTEELAFSDEIGKEDV